MNEPQVVHYEGNVEFYKVNFDKITLTFAIIPLVLDHPKLGKSIYVKSSVVCSPIDDEGSFYTMNTLYKKSPNESSQND